MLRNCKVCNQPIPEARLKVLPNTLTCVNHSSSEKKVGIPITLGQGDHTYVELSIMESEEYKRLQQISKRELNTL